MRAVPLIAAVLLLAACQGAQTQVSCRPVTVDTHFEDGTHSELICVPREAVAANGYQAYRDAAERIPRTEVR